MAPLHGQMVATLIEVKGCNWDGLTKKRQEVSRSDKKRHEVPRSVKRLFFCYFDVLQ